LNKNDKALSAGGRGLLDSLALHDPGRDPETPLKQVAFRLGFSHPESFHRAFKRWTSETPVIYRERARASARKRLA
jgi:AraC-like DNA-binding protein